MIFRAALALAAALAAAPALSLTCETIQDGGTAYSVCTADPREDRIDLWLTDAEGRGYGGFAPLAEGLAAQGRTLQFAMNGGMYHVDRRPVGLFLADGRKIAPLVTREGPGNFGLLPNGVFCVTDAGAARVIESRTFAAEAPACRIATQSGPMLVIDGALHPAFIEGGASRLLRNGVGVRPDGTVAFAMADSPVNFHDFATFFRDTLGTPNALFLEGRVVRLYSTALGRNDSGLAMGPIIGVSTAKE